MAKIKVLFLSWQPALLFSLLSLFLDDPIVALETKNLAEFHKQIEIEKIGSNLILLDDAFSNRDQRLTTNNFLYNNEAKKIIFTECYETKYIDKLIKCGAKGIISKYANLKQIREAIIRVNNNENYFYENILNIHYAKTLDDDLFTSREKEIMSLIGEGYTSRIIATKLFISKKTVDFHRRNLLRKLHFETSSELIAYAARNDNK